MYSVPWCFLRPSQVSKLCKFNFVYSECLCVLVPVCVCVCVCVRVFKMSTEEKVFMHRSVGLSEDDFLKFRAVLDRPIDKRCFSIPLGLVSSSVDRS